MQNRNNGRRNSNRDDQKRRNSTSKDKNCNSKIAGKDNDASWYLMNGQLAKDVANFSFNLANGAPVTFSPGRVYDIPTTLTSSIYQAPGVASVLTGPAVGAALSEISPINVAARNIYSFVRHANSGHANYDPADLMIYLLAVDSVQTYWSWMVRLYGVCQTFSQRNRYVGDALITAMGANPNSIRTHMAELRAYINQYAIKASVLAVPNTMSYYIRHAWMYQNVYMDEDNAKAQMFMFIPAYVFKYGLDGRSVGALSPLFVTATQAASNGRLSYIVSNDFDSIKAKGDELINAMLSQEDVGIMSGDILKAYGSDKLYRFNQIAEDYAVVPTYSEEVLGQFHNLNMVGRTLCVRTNDGWKADATSALTVSQDVSVGSGNLVWNPAFLGAMDCAYTHIIDSWKADVTPEDALVYSRLQTWTNPQGGSVVAGNITTEAGYVSSLSSCGSEIVFDVVILHYVAGTLMADPVKSTDLISPDAVNTAVITLMDKFNEFPIYKQYAKSGVLQSFYGELSNFATVNETECSAMHNAALLSMLGVPYNW